VVALVFYHQRSISFLSVVYFRIKYWRAQFWLKKSSLVMMLQQLENDNPRALSLGGLQIVRGGYRKKKADRYNAEKKREE